MKKMTFLFSLWAVFFALPSCGTSPSNEAKQQEAVIVEEMPVDTIDVIPADTAFKYSDVVDKKNCFILISKPEYRLSSASGLCFYPRKRDNAHV